MASYGKKTRNPGYVAGRHWVACDVCGFVVSNEDARERWDGAIVCPEDWEPRHPQDFVRARDEEIFAGWPQRPEPEGIDVSPDYILPFDYKECWYPANSGWAGLAVAGCAVPYAGNEQYWPTDYYFEDSIVTSEVLSFNHYYTESIEVTENTVYDIYIYEGSVAGYATAGYAIAGED